MSSAVVKALVAARQKCLTEDEAYWDPKPDFTRPVSARNEAAALSWLLDHQAVVCRGGPADVAELQALCTSYCIRMGAAAPPEQASSGQREGPAANMAAEAAAEAAAGPANGAGSEVTAAGTDPTASSSGRSFDDSSVEAVLQRWCIQRGVRGAVSPALFAGGNGGGDGAPPDKGGPLPLRGLRADTPVTPGDVVLHVPSDLLISYETARESDLGKVLSALPLGLSDDSIALIWTCVERKEPEAVHTPFWAALPDRFSTGLSASDAEMALLEGTPLYAEAMQARKHLRDAFESSSPAFRSLMGAYPDYFKPEWFSWESYLWAAELWYSYGIQVQLSNGNICTCLAPYLGLMNHHPLPHIVHFSKVDPQTGCLRVRAFRSCAPGCQLFLSYGPYSNAKLLLFYGFALKDNPADEVDLVLQVPSGPTATDRRAVLAAAGLPLEQRLRAGGRIAPAVLACARLLAAPPEILKQLRRVPPSELKARLAAPGSTEAEAEAMRMLVDAIDALLCPARECARRLQMAEGDKANLTSDSTQRQDAAAAPPSLGSERVSLATGTDGDGRVGAELRHFARLYVDGLIQILEDSRAAVSRAMEMAGACA